MEPENNNRITVSSNKPDARNLRSMALPQWISDIVGDNYGSPFIVVELPETSFIKKVYANNTHNIKVIKVIVSDSEGNEVT